jgi:cytochrome c
MLKQMFAFTGSLALLSTATIFAPPAMAQDAGAGATLFKQTCQMCHNPPQGPQNVLGPTLKGVFGRKAAVGSFTFSDPLKKSGIVWTQAALDKFLAAPATMVPGTRMPIGVANAKQRADLIAYLRTLK